MVYYYIDFENVRLNGLKGKTDIGRIKTALYGVNIKASVTCRIVNSVSKNALDFELISDLFMSRSKCMKVIISKDKGFDAAINEGKRNNVLCFRKTSIKGSRFETFLEFYGEKSKEYVLC